VRVGPAFVVAVLVATAGCGSGNHAGSASTSTGTRTVNSRPSGPPPNPDRFAGGARCPGALDLGQDAVIRTRYLILCKGATASQVAEPCRENQLRLKGNLGQGATGSWYSGVSIRHPAGPPCTVVGTMEVSLVDAHGDLIDAQTNPASVHLDIPIGAKLPTAVVTRLSGYCGPPGQIYIHATLGRLEAVQRTRSAGCNGPGTPVGFSAFSASTHHGLG
jgi:hypothetical protein